jgi:membrane protease YdiL (CAAX protease family)
VATANYSLDAGRARNSLRDLAELIFGYGFITLILWLPAREQAILSPIALVTTFAIVWLGGGTRDDLGLGWRGLIPSLRILPAALVLAGASVLVARWLGTLHPLYHADVAHVTGYLLWTTYQQILLQDYFMPRLHRLLGGTSAAVAATTVLFAAAHMPNLTLTAATLVWGVVSCVLFLRYRNIYVLGLAQGLLGLCFAVCVPDALHHHLRVGLGYLQYHATAAIR